MPPEKQIKNIDFGILKYREKRIPDVQYSIVNASAQPRYGRRPNKEYNLPEVKKILSAVNCDFGPIRELSQTFFQRNGIYQRAIRYLADLYKFDYFVIPQLDQLDRIVDDTVKNDITKRFYNCLEFLANTDVKQLCKEICLKVLVNGAYYGYISPDTNSEIVMQELPANYCRSQFEQNGKRLVEMNMKYFDDNFKDEELRDQYLKLFPKEIQDGYRKYKKNKLKARNITEQSGWTLLDVKNTYVFFINSNQIPPLIYAIIPLIKIDDASDLLMTNAIQQLEVLLIQKFPLDDQGDSILSKVQMDQLDNNLKVLLEEIVGVNIVSTVADISVEPVKDTSENVGAAQAVIANETDQAYSQLGISKNLFNTGGNLALDKSIKVDEAYIRPILLQLVRFFQDRIDIKFPKSKKKQRLLFDILETTIFNYQEVQEDYRKLVTLGFSKILPMVAAGHTMEQILSIPQFENHILDLDFLMLPPLASNNVSPDVWVKTQIAQQSDDPIQTIKELIDEDEQEEATGVDLDPNVGGRPNLPTSQLSDKTIANQASM